LGFGSEVFDELVLLGGELTVIQGFEKQGTRGGGVGEDGNDCLAGAESAHLFGAADFGDVGAFGEDGDEGVGVVYGVFDIAAPGCAAVDLLRVEPRFEVGLGKKVAELVGEGGAVFAGVRDEDAARGGLSLRFGAGRRDGRFILSGCA
jgi:hypothetical protein